MIVIMIFIVTNFADCSLELGLFIDVIFKVIYIWLHNHLQKQGFKIHVRASCALRLLMLDQCWASIADIRFMSRDLLGGFAEVPC